MQTASPDIFSLPWSKINMEKRILGIILSILGIIGLLYCGISFISGGSGEKNVKLIIFTGIIGAIFFFAGIALVKNTKDKET